MDTNCLLVNENLSTDRKSQVGRTGTAVYDMNLYMIISYDTWLPNIEN